MSHQPIQVQDHRGLSRLLDLRDLLLRAGLPEDRVPREREMELIAARHRGTADAAGVLVASEHGRVVGYAPYLERKRDVPVRLGEKVLGRLRFDAVQLLRPNSSQWGEAPTICGAILEHLSLARRGAAVCASEVDTGGVLWAAMEGAGRRYYRLSRSVPFAHMFHLFGDSYETFLRGRSKNTREKIKHYQNKLTRIAGNDLTLDEYTQESAVPRFLTTANEISTRTYQARLFGEVVECTDESVCLYQHYARYGLFRSYVLRAASKPIAFLLAYGEPDGTHVWMIQGYDPDFRDGSPGTNCCIMILKRLYELGAFTRIDFGGGFNEQKRIFANYQRMSVSPMLFPRTISGVAQLATETLVEGANRRAVALVSTAQLRSRVKRWLRR